MNFYEVLQLPIPTAASLPLSPAAIKDAYRSALLRHHPDKLRGGARDGSAPSIDEIALAYQTLSSPALREAYDGKLLSGKKKKNLVPGDGHGFQTGLELADLDDLSYDEQQALWFRSCRCGQERGFVLEQAQLEKAADAGDDEVAVGCKGCSLWLNVSFAVAEGDECDLAEAKGGVAPNGAQN